MNDLWNLQKLDLFSGLESATIERVLQIITVKHVEHGEFIFRPGDPSERLYLLHHGRIKTYVCSDAGQEKIMHVFHPGDAFGGLLMGTTHGELPWAQAMEDVVVSYMDEPAFIRFMREFPELCMGILRYMAKHHAEDMRRMERFIHTSAIYRLVHTLLDLGDRLGYAKDESFEVTPGFTHEELANIVGVTRSTASEMINQLRRDGVLGGQGRSLIVFRKAAEQFLSEAPI